MQSSCFLQLCLKVNLVVERSPQLRERWESDRHCSRGKPRGAHKPLRRARCASGHRSAPQPSPPSPLSLPFFPRAPGSALRASPLPSLLSPLASQHSPRSLAPAQTHRPLGQLSPVRHHRVRAWVSSLPARERKRGGERERKEREREKERAAAPRCCPHRVSISPGCCPLPFSRIARTGSFLNGKEREEPPVTHTRVNSLSPRGKTVLFT